VGGIILDGIRMGLGILFFMLMVIALHKLLLKAIHLFFPDMEKLVEKIVAKILK